MPLVYPGSLTPNTPEDTNDLNAILAAINTWANGNIDTDDILDNAIETAKIAAGAVTAAKLDTTLAAQLGVGTGARGQSIIATEESFTQTSYAVATTPDRVSDIVLPTDGLIFAAFIAEWKKSAAGPATAYASLYLDENQVKFPNYDVGNASPGTFYNAETVMGTVSGSNVYNLLASAGHTGLRSAGDNGSAAAWPTTGTVLGLGNTDSAVAPYWYGGVGIIPIFAAAGTYDLSVRYKSSSGSITVKNRKLWAWTMDF